VTGAVGTIAVGVGGKVIGQGFVKGEVNEVNGGTIEAQGGPLIITGQVSGGGTLLIDDGATLSFESSNANAVRFEGPAGILKMPDPTKFTGKITGLEAGDTIDFRFTKISRVSLNGHTLTVTEADHSTLTYQVCGTFTNTGFAIQSDGHGGDQIVLMAIPAPSRFEAGLQNFTVAMASFGPTAGAAEPPVVPIDGSQHQPFVAATHPQ
jgi:hypothetical protein